MMEPLDHIADLGKAIMVPPESFDVTLKDLDWSWHQIARGEYPPPFTSLEELQLAIICADPVLWTTAFLRNPDDPDRPWQFWDYQQESIRYPGNTLHECGAEVGKTREIIGYILWKVFTVPNGSGLVTAPMTIHLMEIIDTIVEQLNHNPALGKALVLHRKQPHHHLKFANGFKVDFRPTGHDGEALRGVHVSTFAMFDEAAKAKNKDIFKEFWRASKPGCVHKLYSTPDGDRSCVFYRLCQKADGKLKVDEAEQSDDAALKTLEFRKFQWSKELMPAPFWTPERRRFYIDQYGGEDSPGYQQNVLGNWGDPENSVFPWYQFSRLLHEIPEYRCLKILVDESHGEISLYGYELQPQIIDGVKGKPDVVVICDRRMSKRDFDISAEIKAFFDPMPGLLFGGADLGFSQDPTEIYVKLIYGKAHRLICRLQLKGVTYDQQAEAINALDDIYDAGQNKMGWGVDFGNAGSAVVHILQGQDQYQCKDFESRLTGYQFGAAYDAVNEDGDLIIDKKTNKPIRLSAKELSTDLLTTKMQRTELQYPYDPDIVLFYPNHTYRNSSNRRIYKDVDDHVIDADRVLTLRVVLPGDNQEDLFA
ncbi:MAG: hypothetical protein AB7T17_06780 [Geobacter sp.]